MRFLVEMVHPSSILLKHKSNHLRAEQLLSIEMNLILPFNLQDCFGKGNSDSFV